MATWVTHLIIADKVMEKIPELDRRGFCVGNIAPDCNVESADWKSFTPSRKVTHWMGSESKTAASQEKQTLWAIYLRQRRILNRSFFQGQSI